MHRGLETDKRISALALISLLAAALLLPLLTAGCGPSTPEDTVRSFLKAIDDNDWNGFLSSILPDEVRKMTIDDTTYWRDQALAGASDSVRFNAEQLQMMSRPEGEDRARVRVTGGEIALVQMGTDSDVVLNMKDRTFTAKDPETGQMKTEKFGEQEEAIARDLAEYEVVRYKGSWYVDFKLTHSIDDPVVEDLMMEELEFEEMEFEELDAE